MLLCYLNYKYPCKQLGQLATGLVFYIITKIASYRTLYYACYALVSCQDFKLLWINCVCKYPYT